MLVKYVDNIIAVVQEGEVQQSERHGAMRRGAQEKVWDEWGWNRDTAQTICTWTARQGGANQPPAEAKASCTSLLYTYCSITYMLCCPE